MPRGQWQNINIRVDLKGFERKLSQQAFGRGRSVVADQVLSDSNRYVPADSYTMRTTGYVNADGSAVHWHTPYAKAQFYGTNGMVVFRNYTTPGTGKLWHSKAARVHRSGWEKAFIRGVGL